MILDRRQNTGWYISKNVMSPKIPYYWYLSKDSSDLAYPPKIPDDTKVADGSGYLHINTSTSEKQSWVKVGDDGQHWTPLEVGTEHNFAHGCYVFNYHITTPSWSTAETFRKRRYLELQKGSDRASTSTHPN